MARQKKRRRHLGGHRKHRRHLRGHRRRHHRHRGALGDLRSQLSKETRLSSPIVGAVAGLAVTAGLKVLVSNVQALQNAIPNVIQNNMILVGSLLAGGTLYLVRRKKDHHAAVGNLVGAVAAGGVAWTWDSLVSLQPATFGDVVTLNLANGRVQKAMRGLNGLIINETPPRFPPTGMSGLLVNDSASGYAGLITPDNPGKQGLQNYPGYGGYGDGGTSLDDDNPEDPTEGFAT